LEREGVADRQHRLPNAWFPVFLAVSVPLILVLPKVAPWFFRRYGDRVIEPEIKLVFV
jgi:hypothetical protein